MQQRVTDVRSRSVRPSLVEKIARRAPGISRYGLAPPKQATPPNELESIGSGRITCRDHDRHGTNLALAMRPPATSTSQKSTPATGRRPISRKCPPGRDLT